ncbi:MAG: PH domain-containing protein [Chloroflexota bacterium]
MTKTFEIAPASSTPYIFLAAIGLILVLLLALFVFTGYSMKNGKFEVTDQGLAIKTGAYGRFIPKDIIVRENVRTLNFNNFGEYKPRWRTNGIGLPGYSEGWFRLNNKEKALLFVTDSSKVVYIPTTRGYSIMLSPQNPEQLAYALKEWK